MSCSPERVSAYVDSALDPAGMSEVENHLPTCATCREQAEYERRLRTALKALPEPSPRAGFEPLRPPRRQGAALRWGLRLAAALVLLALGQRLSGTFVAWELARDHEICFRSEQLPAEVWSSDAAEVGRWFEKEGRSMPYLPSAAGSFELVGARHCSLPDRTVAAHLYYQGEGRHLSLFVLESRPWSRGQERAVVASRVVRVLQVGGITVGLVGERSEDVEALHRGLNQTYAQLTALEAVGIVGVPTRGAVAQLGARVNGIHEVTGSIPVSSTK